MLYPLSYGRVLFATLSVTCLSRSSPNPRGQQAMLYQRVVCHGFATQGVEPPHGFL